MHACMKLLRVERLATSYRRLREDHGTELMEYRRMRFPFLRLSLWQVRLRFLEIFAVLHARCELSMDGEEWGTHEGVSTNTEQVEKDFAEVERLGFNTLRWFVCTDGRGGMEFNEEQLDARGAAVGQSKSKNYSHVLKTDKSYCWRWSDQIYRCVG